MKRVRTLGTKNEVFFVLYNQRLVSTLFKLCSGLEHAVVDHPRDPYSDTTSHVCPCSSFGRAVLAALNIEHLEVDPGVSIPQPAIQQGAWTVVSELRTLQRKELADPC